jgi:hypothetical protein
MNNALRASMVVLFLCAGVSCSRHESQVGKEIPLDDGVFMKVSRVRAWESYDHDVPPLDPYQHWVSQGSKKGGFSISVRPFTGEERVTPKGRFWELLVWIENKGVKETAIPLYGKDEEGLDLHLMLGSGVKMPMCGYRVPGFNISDMSLVVASQGRLQAELKPTEKTWLLVVFDVPREQKSAQFQIKNASPVRITLPKGN